MLTPAQNLDVHKGAGDRCRRSGTGYWLILICLEAFIAIPAFGQTKRPPVSGSGLATNTCSLPGLAPDSGKKLKIDDLLAAYNSQAALVHSMQASLIVHAKGGADLSAKVRNSGPTPVMLVYRAPASLRMTGVIPFSSRRSFDMSSDGSEFRLLVPDGEVMRFFVGPVDAPPDSPNPRENLRPQPIIDALHWLPARLPNASESARTKNGKPRTIDVELARETGKPQSAQLEFDLRSGTLSRLALFDSGGKEATEVRYSDWQRIQVSGVEDRAACYPKRMFVTRPQESLDLEMRFLSIQMNASVTPLQLRLLPPRGIPVTRIDPQRRSNHP